MVLGGSFVESGSTFLSVHKTWALCRAWVKRECQDVGGTV